MITLVKIVFSAGFWIGGLLGTGGMYFLKPMFDAWIAKTNKKNS